MAPDENGVTINLVSHEKLTRFSMEDKLNFIVDEVKGGKILVLEQGLDPIEEAKLIEVTMSKIDADEFIGIEMQSHNPEDPGLFARLFRGKTRRAAMTVVGPGDRLRTIHKDGSTIQAVIVTGEGVKGAAEITPNRGS